MSWKLASLLSPIFPNCYKSWLHGPGHGCHGLEDRDVEGDDQAGGHHGT
jgi:hypothetical protein